MYIFLSILIVIVALLLIGAITIQESKGGGLAAGFSSSNTVLGVQRATNGIEKITWWLAGIMAVLCIATAHFAPKSSASMSQAPESVIGDYVDQATIPAPMEAQPFGEAPAAPAETETAPATTPETAPAAAETAPAAAEETAPATAE